MTPLVAAWQAALAAEHQAVFGYALLGPHLSGADEQLAVACSNAHEALRDATETALAQAGVTPVAPAADYPALYPVPDARAARLLAIRLEDASAVAWRFLYLQAASAPGARAHAVRPGAQAALTASAVRGTRWRALIAPGRASVPFPGA
jgi:hypothetical protein